MGEVREWQERLAGQISEFQGYPTVSQSMANSLKKRIGATRDISVGAQVLLDDMNTFYTDALERSDDRISELARQLSTSRPVSTPRGYTVPTTPEEPRSTGESFGGLLSRPLF